jgi:hypothetical protein
MMEMACPDDGEGTALQSKGVKIQQHYQWSTFFLDHFEDLVHFGSITIN